MAIIDGQHRVYAYYEDSEKNTQEILMCGLRKELNLLVTGIIYPNTDKYNDELERRKFESNLFVSINKNAKPVDADTLIQVQAIIIAFRETLKITNGPQNYNFYMNVFKGWNFSFENSKDKQNQFPYAGAQYSKFARNEIIPLFKKYVVQEVNVA